MEKVKIKYGEYQVETMIDKFSHTITNGKNATINFLMLIYNESVDDFIEECKKAEAAFSLMYKDFEINFTIKTGDSERLKISLSENTGSLCVPEITLMDSELHTIRSATYQVKIQYELSADVLGVFSASTGYKLSQLSVIMNPAEILTITISGSFGITKDTGGDALNNYVTFLNTVFTRYLDLIKKDNPSYNTLNISDFQLYRNDFKTDDLPIYTYGSTEGVFTSLISFEAEYKYLNVPSSFSNLVKIEDITIEKERSKEVANIIATNFAKLTNTGNPKIENQNSMGEISSQNYLPYTFRLRSILYYIYPGSPYNLETIYKNTIQEWLKNHIIRTFSEPNLILNKDNTRIEMQTNKINIDWELIAPNNSDIISLDCVFRIFDDEGITERKIQDGLAYTLALTSPGAKRYASTLVTMFTTSPRSSKLILYPGDKGTTTNAGWVILNTETIYGEKIREEIQNGEIKTLYNYSFESKFVYIVPTVKAEGQKYKGAEITHGAI
jgi:hypothetical protein